jgi:hypothetical protein
MQPFGKFKKDVLRKFGDAQRHGARTEDAWTRDAITLTASDQASDTSPTSTHKALNLQCKMFLVSYQQMVLVPAHCCKIF